MGELILTALALLGVGSSATSSPSTTSGSSTQGPTVSPADAGVEPAVRTGGKRTPAFTSLIGICLRRRASRLANESASRREVLAVGGGRRRGPVRLCGRG